MVLFVNTMVSSSMFCLEAIRDLLLKNLAVSPQFGCIFSEWEAKHPALLDALSVTLNFPLLGNA